MAIQIRPTFLREPRQRAGKAASIVKPCRPFRSVGLNGKLQKSKYILEREKYTSVSLGQGRPISAGFYIPICSRGKKLKENSAQSLH